jgi:C4-dicarboxylate-specific signal transduction histidine kinase
MDWTLAVCLLALVEAVLIAALLIERRRLRRTSLDERQVAEELARMVHLAVSAEIAASVSSKLVQPATAMLINIETAATTLRSPQPDMQILREVCEDLRLDCERIAAVLHALRDRPMQRSAATGPLDLNGALGKVIDLIRPVAQREGIEVRTAFAERLPSIEADSIQVLGVVMNLCLSSIELMRQSRQGPRVLTLASSQNDGAVTVSVRDSVPGLTAKRVPLLVATRIVESQGGRLWTDPDAEGTTRGFALPALVED